MTLRQFVLNSGSLCSLLSVELYFSLSSTVSKNWKNDKTLKQNMDALGIAYNCNDVIPLKRAASDEVHDNKCFSVLMDWVWWNRP